MKKLSPRQRLFVHEYLVDLNATQAARRAGYKKTHVQGSRLLANASVAAAIAKAMEKKTGELIMTREEILRELTIIGGFRPSQVYTQVEGGELLVKSFEDMGSAQGAIAEIKEDRIIKEVVGDDKKPDTTMVLSDKRTLRFHDKLRALELLGRHENLFPTKIEGDLTIRAKLSLADYKKSIKGIQDADPGD